MRVSDRARGRDNNFNLVRILAALGVLATHSFALVTGDGSLEPLRRSVGMTMGTIAVDLFFATSGFLVTASLLERKSTRAFLVARILRIYPAVVVMTALTVFVLGPAFTARPLSAYLGDRATWAYLWKCSTLLGGVAYVLPGVFADNPYPAAVNGSLWTMPYEIKMYLVLAVLWLAAKPLGRLRERAFATAVVLAVPVLGGLLFANFYLRHVNSQFVMLAFMFFTGAAFRVLEDRIVLSPWAAAVLGGLLLAAFPAGRTVFFGVYYLAVAYVLFVLALVPGGAVRAYNRLGDYSYGVYIYAFPVQQAICHLVPGISVAALMAASAIATLACAALSWHLLEKWALALKVRFAAPGAVP